MTNKKIYIIMGIFFLISEILYITLMIKIPNDIMENEKARVFVEKVGRYIPKIQYLERFAEEYDPPNVTAHHYKNVVPTVMPFFYSIVCLWCLGPGSLITYFCKGFRFSNNEHPYKGKRLRFGGAIIFGITIGSLEFFFEPGKNISTHYYGSLIYSFKTSAAVFGAIYVTFLYFIALFLILNLKPIIISYIRLGETDG